MTLAHLGHKQDQDEGKEEVEFSQNRLDLNDFHVHGGLVGNYSASVVLQCNGFPSGLRPIAPFSLFEAGHQSQA